MRERGGSREGEKERMKIYAGTDVLISFFS